jgi:predicted site-specific integrase-resolvase
MMKPSDLENRVGSVDLDMVKPSQLANHWGVHINTVYRDIRKGALPVLRLPSGRFRIRRSDAVRYGRPNE